MHYRSSCHSRGSDGDDLEIGVRDDTRDVRARIKAILDIRQPECGNQLYGV